MPKTRVKGRARKMHLATEIAWQCGLPMKTAEAVTDCVFQFIADTLRDGNSIRLPNVGLLQVVSKYDVRWLNPPAKWQGLVPRPQVKFVPNRHLFYDQRMRDKARHSGALLQSQARLGGDPPGPPAALPEVSPGGV